LFVILGKFFTISSKNSFALVSAILCLRMDNKNTLNLPANHAETLASMHVVFRDLVDGAFEFLQQRRHYDAPLPSSSTTTPTRNSTMTGASSSQPAVERTQHHHHHSVSKFTTMTLNTPPPPPAAAVHNKKCSTSCFPSRSGSGSSSPTMICSQEEDDRSQNSGVSSTAVVGATTTTVAGVGDVYDSITEDHHHVQVPSGEDEHTSSSSNKKNNNNDNKKEIRIEFKRKRKEEKEKQLLRCHSTRIPHGWSARPHTFSKKGRRPVCRGCMKVIEPREKAVRHKFFQRLGDEYETIHQFHCRAACMLHLSKEHIRQFIMKPWSDSQVQLVAEHISKTMKQWS